MINPDRVFWPVMLFVVIVVVLPGCGGNFYVKGGLGWNGSGYNGSATEWTGDDEVGGRLAAGWRRPVSANWNIDVNAYHHSQPYLDGDDPETTSEHIYLDLEYLIR